MWPAHSFEVRPWVSANRAGNREDRLFTQVTTAIPPLIAAETFAADSAVLLACENATIAITRLDVGRGEALAPLGDFLLRSESVASSKIEHVNAGWRQFGRAIAGVKAGSEAKSQLAAVQALATMIAAADTGTITAADLLSAHRQLMEGNVAEAPTAGTFRTVQNWIGGSDYTPRGALFVPPPPELVLDLIDDLIAFVDRTDIPVVAQAAIAHAQFESIHPHTDGNGRIGRALISAILRRRGLTRKITVPLASVMLADTDTYFATLGAYRRGDAAAFVTYVADAATLACAAADESADQLDQMPAYWRTLANPRSGSSEESIIDALLARPVLDADTAQEITGSSDTATYRALNKLTDAGILEVISESKRDRVWAAVDVMNELELLSDSIGRRTGPNT
ncbi:Fic family protein [Tsukamurella tyrosinosolvens]|uniref:Fic family protein n=1 Tax=Tsukamurella tyrosinosolvens TaxID=57704 RepID=UPI000C7EFB07|nr:Fic family protein [Tsukamurella tyrosinosolvens]AUN38691.1 filamentation induced by cAMP protein fic [Tsukamurella tyrosinosolvens]